MGNVINRVFESSGPEGKVRGTPQQVIDKYNQLARDAQLSGDRVMTENFQQHAEHYLRLLGAAQREQEARREEQERMNRERQAERDRDRARRQERELNPGTETSTGLQTESGDSEGGDSGLVETPESQPQAKPAKRGRKPRKKTRDGDQAAEGDDDAGSAPESGQGDAPGPGSTEAAE